MEKLAVEIAFKDDRGEIIDLLENETVNAVTVITFKKGAVRANHFHKQTTQWNYLITGKIKFYGQFPGEEIKSTVMNPGDFVVSRPNDSHAMKALEDSTIMVFTKGPRGGKEYESDTFRLDKPISD